MKEQERERENETQTAPAAGKRRKLEDNGVEDEKEECKEEDDEEQPEGNETKPAAAVGNMGVWKRIEMPRRIWNANRPFSCGECLWLVFAS